MTSENEKQLRTPLKRVSGLGSAKEGVQHWWQTRLTSVALIPLTLWLVWNMVRFSDASFEQVHSWASNPINAGLLILLTAIMFLHAASGIQAVLEDYVHREGRKLVFIYGVKAILYGTGFAVIFSILKIAFHT